MADLAAAEEQHGTHHQPPPPRAGSARRHEDRCPRIRRPPAGRTRGWRVRCCHAPANGGRPPPAPPARPARSSIRQRSAIDRMDGNSCVTTTKVAPSVSRRRRMRWSSSADVTGSSPADGSSRNSSGRVERQRPGDASALGHSARGSRAAAACRGIGQADLPQFDAGNGRTGIRMAARVRVRSGSATFSSRVSEPNKRAGLKHDADFAPHRLRVGGDIVPHHADLAGR